MFASACSGLSVLYSGAPCAFASPVVTLHSYSGTPSSVATSNNSASSRSSSGVSTVMAGWRELISSRNSSRLLGCFGRAPGPTLPAAAIGRHGGFGGIGPAGAGAFLLFLQTLQPLLP